MSFFNSLASMAADAVEDAVTEALAPPEAETRAFSGGQDAGDFDAQSEERIPGMVRMFSGCRDSQTSADVFDASTFNLPEECGPGGAGGACTNAMLSSLLNSDSGPPTWAELLQSMRAILQEKNFSQVPQLSGSRPLVLGEQFSVVGNPDGNKRALLIGINYVGQQGELRGCHNDVLAMKDYIESQGFPSDSDSMRVLMDDGEHEMPTMANMLAAFAWLTAGAQEGDSLFMHYSGHGGSVRDTNNDEKDGKDETLIPVDYREAGQITDDVILSNLVLEVPRGAMLTTVIDACHSGTVLDLPYTLVADEAGMQSVASGDVAMLPQNSEFSFAQLVKVGQLLFEMHSQGASTEEIATAAFSQLSKSGLLKGLF